ncbi:MAG TPA: malto-oligosyltrehalose trehalohydrolase [Thermoanaerobaculia bacterium]|nr:malto-oligosyltrehalose trehalohydrolase [Thermoanaerobaculia bacterium]
MQADHGNTNAVSLPGTETFPSAGEQQSPTPRGIPLGAHVLDGNRCEFRVWAPDRERVELHIVAPSDRRVPMQKGVNGYHEAVVDDCAEGTRYMYVLDGGAERPDPASRLQPEGVHGPSEVVGSDFQWHDEGWTGVGLEDYVVYELHVGTFTQEGTFDSAIEKLDYLKELGVTAVELLPVAQFPGGRNWGYDGTYVGAVQNTYGGPRALKRLVDACHQRGMAVLLDVVYNHLGPEGNYLGEYGPYFTDRYKTPWGLALNFDGAHSDDVRWYFIHSALQFVDEFHFDGLRVDAVHAIVDHSAEPFLQDLCTAVRNRAEKLGRRIYTIAESDLNDPRVISPAEEFGMGFDSQWADDFHHSMHTLLTGEQDGYYQGFPPRVSNLAHVFTTGYLYVGQHSVYRGRKYGLKPRTKNGAQFVISMQNHDQVGNRMLGDRIASFASVEKVRLAAAATILAPFVPMLFMGEEYGEKSPFQYFTSHSDKELIEAVRKGRREEFDDFAWQGEAPDPHDEETFRRSKLNWGQLDSDEHQSVLRLYKQLLQLRRDTPALRALDLSSVEVHADDARGVLVVRRGGAVLLGFNFSDEAQTVDVPFANGSWRPLLDTGSTVDGGHVALPPWAFALWSAEA